MNFISKVVAEIKKKFILIGLCTLIIFGCWYSLYNHYQLSDQEDDLLGYMENKILDLKFIIRGPRLPTSKIGILAIDEKSIEQFGRWPFSRRYYSQSLDNLKNAGVKWIGFDAVFSEKEVPTLSDLNPHLNSIVDSVKNKTSHQQLKKTISRSISNISKMKQSAPGDLMLAEGIRRFENIVLGYFYFNSKNEVIDAGLESNPFDGLNGILRSKIEIVILSDERQLTTYKNGLKAYGLVSNTPTISEATPHSAFFSSQADKDAIIRWVTQVKIINGVLLPSLSLKLAAEIMERDIVVFMNQKGVERIELVSRNEDDESSSLRIPLDPLGVGRVLVNHRGAHQTFRHISLADAYNNNFSDEEREYLNGAVLMLGMTAIGINDQRPNPFDASLDGVENHAAVVDNILNDDFLQRPTSIYNIEMLIIILIGLLFVPLLLYSRASFAGIAAILFLVGYYYFDKHYWFSRGIWAYLGMPFLEIIILFITVTLYKYMTEEAEKRRVKGAFSHYLSQDVIDQVLDDPQSLQLGGVRKNLTVFFSDVRGFTTISESLNPEQLCQFMNTYFTPMTGIILRSEGVLDKYIGDAVMAFWGAPIPIIDQADRAADASIEMLMELDKLQRYFHEHNLPRCDIGIGLNTGPMSVGNMGSDERFCYTVMGDAVNLGARLEGLTKEYGIKILISEFTVAAFTKDHHLYRDLDDIRVKGKKEPVKVFDLMRPDMLPKPDDIKELIGVFAEARHYYLKQMWNEATKKFEQCKRINPNDGPSQAYLARIEIFQNQPHMENWDGVYTFTHK